MFSECGLISIALGACVLLSATSVSRGQSGDEGQAAALFPLMGWGGMSPTEPHVKGLAECGMTLANFAPGSTLDLCHEYGLKLIIQDPSAESCRKLPGQGLQQADLMIIGDG